VNPIRRFYFVSTLLHVHIRTALYGTSSFSISTLHAKINLAQNSDRVWQTFRETVTLRDQFLCQRPHWLSDEETNLEESQELRTEAVGARDDIWADLIGLAEVLSDKASLPHEDRKPTMSAIGGDIRLCEGLDDGKENIKIFIDMEFLAEYHDRKAPASAKTMLRVFRRFLKGNAYEFWCS